MVTISGLSGAMRSIIRFGLWIVFMVLLAEGSSYLFGHYFYARAEKPDHRLPKSYQPGGYVGDYFTESNAWGAWHRPNVEVTHKKKCFSVTYRTNSYGARDQEHQRKTGSRRILMLGDSFLEGYGIERKDRISEQLQCQTGFPVLNFGSAGGVGPLQYRILYENMASQFDHDILIVMVLPDNDFTDNWLPYQLTLPEIHHRRYRPYYGSCENDDCPHYPTPPPTKELKLYQGAILWATICRGQVYVLWKHYPGPGRPTRRSEKYSHPNHSIFVPRTIQAIATQHKRRLMPHYPRLPKSANLPVTGQ